MGTGNYCLQYPSQYGWRKEMSDSGHPPEFLMEKMRI